jgi:hypothetical protein
MESRSLRKRDVAAILAILLLGTAIASAFGAMAQGKIPSAELRKKGAVAELLSLVLGVSTYLMWRYHRNKPIHHWLSLGSLAIAGTVGVAWSVARMSLNRDQAIGLGAAFVGHCVVGSASVMVNWYHRRYVPFRIALCRGPTVGQAADDSGFDRDHITRSDRR